MKELLYKRLANLLTVKSLVTIILTVMFAVQIYHGKMEQNFITIYMSVVSFYFGIQSVKGRETDE